MVGGRGSCKKTVRRAGSAGKIQTGPDERPSYVVTRLMEIAFVVEAF